MSGRTLDEFVVYADGSKPPPARVPSLLEQAIQAPVKKVCPRCGGDRIAEAEEKHKRKAVKDGKVQDAVIAITYWFCLKCRNRWNSEEED